ncbi:NADPH-dependent FMN reductase [Methanomicrobiaceae archaeon CYW5]|uniref:flavodoxin family protein n=1 Tax=Methanovulcanius yangii TaxID=1789227 RepID=UPI0029CA6D68|nr:flavodoxin family protein [Methanovulcanius yangii]MBT8508390.1 NADPH-dependent FMN reductase [Methanovulcanius yangii]
MGVKVLAFATSPRRHGNSEDLLDFLLEGMESEGDVAIEKHALDEIEIRPCRGCNACEKLNRCIIEDDDLNWILEKIIDADVVVMASPVYCMGLCAQAKALVDRMQVLRSRKYVLRLPVVPPERHGKRLGVFLATAGQDWDYVFDALIPSVKCFFHVMDIKNKDISYLMINNVDHKGELRAHPTAPDEARELGRTVIREIKGRLAQEYTGEKE